MVEYWRRWTIGLTIGLVALGIACLLWFSNRESGSTADLLLLALNFQSKVTFGISLVSGFLTAVVQRSLWAGGIVLFGVLFGTTIGGSIGLALGMLLITMVPSVSTPDLLLQDFNRGIIGAGIWFLGQAIGVIWGGVDGLDWCAPGNRQRNDNRRM